MPVPTLVILGRLDGTVGLGLGLGYRLGFTLSLSLSLSLGRLDRTVQVVGLLA